MAPLSLRSRLNVSFNEELKVCFRFFKHECCVVSFNEELKVQFLERLFVLSQVSFNEELKASSWVYGTGTDSKYPLMRN